MEDAFFILLILVTGYWALVAQKYRNFKRFLKPDDPVRFYHGEEKLYGKVIWVEREEFLQFGDEIIWVDYDGTVVALDFDTAYPVFTYKYCK